MGKYQYQEIVLKLRAYNQIVNHPLQAWEWGEFKRKMGIEVCRVGAFQRGKLKKVWQVTFHKIPKLPFTVGYLPRSELPDKQALKELRCLGKKQRAIFIKIEPNLSRPANNRQSSQFEKIEETLKKENCLRGKPILAPYTFLIDLGKSEEELLSQMKSKTRYNLRLAKRKGVKVIKDNSQEAFEEYLRLLFKVTLPRQKFFAHNPDYHRKMWETLSSAGIAHLFKAVYKGETLVTWIIFLFKKTLYYPYGASSDKHRNLMASNLMVWEVMRWAKKKGAEVFDMWGALSPNPEKKDPWYGFHRFKQGYGGELVEFIGSFDLIIKKRLYKAFNLAERLRERYLKIIKGNWSLSG